MRIRWRVGQVVLLVTSLAAGAAAAETRTLIVDDAHNEVVRRETAKPPVYVVPASEALKLDASKFDFTRAGYPNLRPNAVRVVVKDSQYFADWPASGATVLSAESLVPVNGPQKFPGFRQGDTAAIEIGIKEVDHAKRQISFKVQWAARVRVK